MTEDTLQSVSESEPNPYWREAEERLRSAGVLQKPILSVNQPSYPTFPNMISPLNAYVPAPMPQVQNEAYNWNYYPPPPPMPRPVYQQPPPPPRNVGQFRPSGGNAVPFNYSSQPTRRPEVFRMNLPQRGPLPKGFQNPLAVSNNDDTLGDPDSGFFMRGKHPASLKEYVKKALSYPKNAEERVKCENYLYARIAPLVNSGACFAVNWGNEPLPHVKNYELATSWTPSNKSKSVSHSTKKDSDSNRHTTTKGKFDDFASHALPGSVRRQNSNEKSSKKAAKKRRQQLNELDRELMFEKRGKFDSTTKCWGPNFLQEWISERKNQSRLSNDLNFMSLNDTVYRRRAVVPMLDRSRLARSFPKVLRNLDQSLVDEYFNRNDGRFNPNDCEEVVGTCLDIEKQYFRLTKKPDPSEIRPVSVLKRAFDKLKTMSRNPENYKYIGDQIRAIRQDLTVQKIRNEFTVEVYEFHARLTLENKDMPEFNQCQSQLRHLYNDLPNCKNEDEFTAYRLLYYIFTQDDQDILSLLNAVQNKTKPMVLFAIRVHDAYLKGHYIRLFKLFSYPPKMCGYLMDLFIDRERRKFFNIIRSSYRPSLKIEILSKWFNFSSQKDFYDYAKTLGIEILPDSMTEPGKWPKI
uniref:SAC3/GANP/THP3 conserved domain-containing protein n=1 Tax=Panagrolaimus sp. JU765 TaxID=591449 RepID=A0AC34R7I4_9BILA